MSRNTQLPEYGSLKDLTADAASLSAHLRLLATDDPRRLPVQLDYQAISKYLRSAREELRTFPL